MHSLIMRSKDSEALTSEHWQAPLASVTASIESRASATMPLARVQSLGMRVCDDMGDGCFVPYAAVPLNQSIPIHGATGMLLEHGHWADEHTLAPLFVEALRGSCARPTGEHKIVLDVGAAIGLYSLYFARRGCRVHAVDPLPLNALALESAALHNRVSSMITVYRSALGTKSGLASLRYSVHHTDDAHNTLTSSSRPLNKGGANPTEWRQTRTFALSLDALVQRNRIGATSAGLSVGRGTIDLLKLDASGSEVDVLDSGPRTLRRVGWLLMTIDPSAMRRGDPMRLRVLLEHHGFAVANAWQLESWNWNDVLRRGRRIDTALFRSNHTAPRLV